MDCGVYSVALWLNKRFVKYTVLMTDKEIKSLITVNSNVNVQRMNGSVFFFCFFSIITRKIIPKISTEVA